MLYIKGTEIPVRAVAMGLVSKFLAEPPEASSIEILSQWLKKGDTVPFIRNINKAIKYARKNWKLTPAGALVTVLYIREFPSQIGKDLRQEEEFYQALKSSSK